LVLPQVLLVLYDGVLLQKLYAVGREAEAIASVADDTVAILIAWPGIGQ
jgi:hypothetical protein